MKYLTPFIVSALLLSSSSLFAGQVNVAVAGNFFKPIKVLASAFELKSGHQVILSTASTGKLYAQINNGAPFELFFAADQRRPSTLVRDNLAVANSQFTYAKGQLVLWSKDINAVDSQGNILHSLGLARLAIANPKAAPYGEQAINALQKMGIYQQIATKLVEGQNIGQTYQYISSGSVLMGIVALSQVMVDGHINAGSYWVIPRDFYQPIQQDAVLLEKGKNNPVAHAFVNYLKSADALKIIRSFGYEVGT